MEGEIADGGIENHEIHERLQEFGLELSTEAIKALCSLSLGHAFELLETVKSKVDMGHIKSPSNYVCATISRGYVPQADGGAVLASIFLAGGDAPPTVQPRPWDGKPTGGGTASTMASLLQYNPEGRDNYAENGYDAAAARLASSKGMLKAQQAQLQLNDDAVRALLQLEPAYASELLETVADKHATLRDPSNYIVATIARGFVPKAGGPPVVPTGATGHVVPPKATAHSSWVPPAYANGSVAKTAVVHGPTSLVPLNVSPLEAKVMELNAQDLWYGQVMSVETLLALRCIHQDQALQLLGSLEAKGRGKGGVAIQNPNNYVQAAVVKIRKGAAEGASATAPRPDGFGAPLPNWNYAGNRTRNKAIELGLDLDEHALKRLARQPLKEAISILEAAAWVGTQDQDPNQYVHNEVGHLEAAEAADPNAGPKASTTFVKEEYGQRAPALRHDSGYDEEGYEKVPPHDVRWRAIGSHLEAATKRTRRC